MKRFAASRICAQSPSVSWPVVSIRLQRAESCCSNAASSFCAVLRTCAGGTGAFIDQMAVLLDMTPDEMDEISLQYKRLYPIASRCGVFAKTDIQPLLNQGANKADVAASIYQAVVNQTITGLAQGRKIDGKVLFLGGPLHYCLGLRDRFRKTLGLDDEHAIFPDYGLYSVALGAAYYGRGTGKEYDYETLIGALEKHADGVGNGRTASF